MTTFLTTAQREFLIEEYKEQLEEFEELEEYGYLLDELRKMNNTDFWQQSFDSQCQVAPGGWDWRLTVWWLFSC